MSLDLTKSLWHDPCNFYIRVTNKYVRTFIDGANHRSAELCQRRFKEVKAFLIVS